MVACRAHLDRGGHVDKEEVADLGHHRASGRACLRVRRYRRADRDAAVPGHLGGDVADARDVEVTIGPGEGEPGGKQPPHVVAVEQRDAAVSSFGQRLEKPAGDGGLARAGQPGEEDRQAALRPGRPGAAQLTCHPGGSEPAGDGGARVEQRAELGVGQLVLFGARLDQRERPPDLGARIVGPVTRGDDRDRHSRQAQRAVLRAGLHPGQKVQPGRADRIRQQVGGAVGGRGDRLRVQVGGGTGVPRGERNRHDERAGRQVLPGGQHRTDQGLRPGHHVGGPGDQGQHEQPRAQLAGVVTQLADVSLVQRPPGGVGQHVAPRLLAGQLVADILRPAPQLAERPVLGRAERGDRAGQPHQPGRRQRIPGGLEVGPGHPFADGEHGKRRALLIGQHDVVRVGGNRVSGDVQRDRDWPRRAVGQRAALGDRRHVGGAHEAVQRSEHPGREQLEIAQVRLVEGAHGPGG